MYVSGIGTATPATHYTQAQCWDALSAAPAIDRLQPRSRAMLQQVLLGDSGIETRPLALDPLEEAFDVRPDVLLGRFVRHAPALAAAAATRALAASGLDVRDIDGIVVSTCTGYLCPGLTSYVIERLGLRRDARALDLVGQGCGAALPNLATAHALLASCACDAVLSICVEVCSAAYYLDDDPGVLVSACLFADSAGAVVLTREPAGDARRVELTQFDSLHAPEERDALRFQTRDGLLRNILTMRRPRLAAGYAERLLDRALGRAGLAREDIASWIWHAGGKRVLAALQAKLALSDRDIATSSGVLRRCGNLSSPFVYFVLEQALRERHPAGWWWMSSFGAGFSCHGALLRVA
jgi:alkylresorcinol/alkylpyrone synthase